MAIMSKEGCLGRLPGTVGCHAVRGLSRPDAVLASAGTCQGPWTFPSTAPSHNEEGVLISVHLVLNNPGSRVQGRETERGSTDH